MKLAVSYVTGRSLTSAPVSRWTRPRRPPGDTLAIACVHGRCGPLAATTAAARATFLRAKDTTVTPVEHARLDPFNRYTRWRATGWRRPPGDRA